MVGLAAGVQINPEKLEFEVSGSKSKTKEIIVTNPTQDVQLFEVYADDYERAITTSPESFILEAGKSKKVSVTVKPSKLSAGIISVNVSIVGKPLAESRLQVNTGVKIPVSIKITGTEYRDLIFPLAVVLLAIIAELCYLFRKRKTGINLII